MVNLRLLQHSGLENRQMKLKPKLVTCSAEFAEKNDLKQASLSEPCSNGQHCIMQPKARLSLILGMDVHNVRLKLIDEFSDSHGSKLILCGNRVYPYTPAQARSALAQHTDSFGVITEETGEQEEDEDLTLPSTSLFHGALQESCPIATWVGPKEPTLKFLEDENYNLPVTYAAAAVNSTLPTSSVPEQVPLTAPPSTTTSLSKAVAAGATTSSSTAAAAGATTSSTKASSLKISTPTAATTMLAVAATVLPDGAGAGVRQMSVMMLKTNHRMV